MGLHVHIPTFAGHIFDCANITRTAHEQYVEALNMYQECARDIQKCEARLANVRANCGPLPAPQLEQIWCEQPQENSPKGPSKVSQTLR